MKISEIKRVTRFIADRKVKNGLKQLVTDQLKTKVIKTKMAKKENVPKTVLATLNERVKVSE